MMWYPEPRYDGEGIQASLKVRSADSPPDIAMGPGNTLSYLAKGSDTGREFGLYQTTLSPGAGTTTHFHRAVSEAFYVLSGAIRLHDGREWLDAKAGDFLYVPVGALHGFKNETDAPATLLNLFVPGADREGYFEAIPTFASMSEEERLRFFHAHDSYFVDAGGGPNVSGGRAQ